MSFVSCPEKNRNKRLDQENLIVNSYMGRIFYSYAKINKTVNFLSLPAQEWIFETHIVKKFPDTKFCFWGCERDPVVHAFADVRAKELNDEYHGRATFQMTHNPGKLYQALIRGEQSGIPDDHEFDVIYADYCGYLCPSVMNDVNAILSNPKNNGGSLKTFALTLGLNSRNAIYYVEKLIFKWKDNLSFKSFKINDDHEVIKLNKGTYSEMPINLSKALPLEIKDLAETNHNNQAGFLEIHTPHIYYSNNGEDRPSTPMGTFSFTRKF